jgi:hypothetical protein
LLQGAVVEDDDTDVHPQCAQGCRQGVQLHLRTCPQVTGSYMEYPGSLETGQYGSYPDDLLQLNSRFVSGKNQFNTMPYVRYIVNLMPGNTNCQTLQGIIGDMFSS